MQLLAFSFGWKDLIDILLVAGILYYTYRLLRRTGASNLFWGILAFILVWFLVSFVFQLDLTGALFDRIISVGAIALIVIFQEELRMFFYRVGSRFSSWKIFRPRIATDDPKARQQILEITQACRHMASTKTERISSSKTLRFMTGLWLSATPRCSLPHVSFRSAKTRPYRNTMVYAIERRWV